MPRKAATRTRAPHGYPDHDARIAIRLPHKLKAKVAKRGGSEWLRKLIQDAP